MSVYNLQKKDLSNLANLTVSSTNDQFIQLRDTLVKSGKKYAGKAGYKLIVDPQDEETIELFERSLFKESFQPHNIKIKGNYLTPDENTERTVYIKKDGWYRIVHKEEILLDEDVNKVHCYVLVRRYEVSDQEVAVFDWEGNNSDYTLGNLIKKMTSFGYIEMDLKKNDILYLKLEDQDGNELTLQDNSNYRSIEYLDLPYNK